MRAHRDYVEMWVVGVFRPDGTHIYMTWDGCGAYGDSCSPEDAEKFESAREAHDWLRKDSEAKAWYKDNPKAKVLRMVAGFTVYPPR